MKRGRLPPLPQGSQGLHHLIDQAARELLEEDPDLSRRENRPVLERVRQLFADTPDIFN